jgi:hypothetical protein
MGFAQSAIAFKVLSEKNTLAYLALKVVSVIKKKKFYNNDV